MVLTKKIYIFFIFQQIFFHLSQKTPRRSNINIKKHKHKRSESQIETNQKNISSHNNKICPESFLETTKNFNIASLASLCQVPVEQILNRNLRNDKISIKEKKPWEISYVSSNSFNQNKNETLTDDSRSFRKKTVPFNISTISFKNLIHNLCTSSG